MFISPEVSRDGRLRCDRIYSMELALQEPKIVSEEKEIVLRNGLGRPLKYRPIFRKKVYEYIRQCDDEWKMRTKTISKDNEIIENKIKVNLPSVEGFSDYIDVGVHAIMAWTQRFSDFSTAVKEIEKAQKKRLIEMSLSGDYNANIAKLILAANHGMRESVDVTSAGQQISQPIINIVNFTAIQNNSIVKKEEKEDEV